MSRFGVRWLCYLCRQPKATLALYAKGGYADGPRPCCRPCYDASAYDQLRFAAHDLPVPIPQWLLPWKEIRGSR